MKAQGAHQRGVPPRVQGLQGGGAGFNRRRVASLQAKRFQASPLEELVLQVRVMSWKKRGVQQQSSQEGHQTVCCAGGGMHASQCRFQLYRRGGGGEGLVALSSVEQHGHRCSGRGGGGADGLVCVRGFVCGVQRVCERVRMWSAKVL